MDIYRLFSLKGKEALVTGGSRGIGYMISQGLLEAGARVYITARKPGPCHEAAAALSKRLLNATDVDHAASELHYRLLQAPGAGQLERELQDNAWLSGPSDESILFELPPDQRWEAAARLLGVDVNLLSSEAGHA